jgi:hypothetical protein
MKHIIKYSLFTIAFFHSAYMLAEDYSGRHVSNDGGGFSLPTPIIIILGLICAAFLLFLNGGKLKDENGEYLGGCLIYGSIIAFIFFGIKACS